MRVAENVIPLSLLFCPGWRLAETALLVDVEPGLNVGRPAEPFNVVGEVASQGCELGAAIALLLSAQIQGVKG